MSRVRRIRSPTGLPELLESIKERSEAGAFHDEAELRQKTLELLSSYVSDRVGHEIAVRLEESLAAGRSDARIAYVVFEFKDPGKLAETKARESAIRETISNLEKTAIRLSEPREKFRGLLTDGKLAQLFAYHAPSDEFVSVDVNEKPTESRMEFRPIVEVAPWLDSAIRVLATREVSPENLLEDFGPGTTLGKPIFAALWNHFRKTRARPRPHQFFEQWKLLFSSSTRKVVGGREVQDEIRSYGIEAAEVRTEDDVREFLFVVHTYYATLLKFLALRIADTIGLLPTTSLLARVQENPASEWRAAEEQLPLLAANLIEKDVFSWFDLQGDRELADCFGAVAHRFGYYDATSVRRDVLKRVYQNVIPPKLRKALGEFYTKDWAAELTLDEAGFEGKGRILDPSCGSGTFLVLSIHRVREALADLPAAKVLETILDSVVGLDLNPVAVSTARINYLLAVVDLLREARPSRGVRIPVYLCNSIVVPSEVRLDPSAPTAEIPTWSKVLHVPFAKGSPQQTIELLRLLDSTSTLTADEFLDSVRTRLGVSYEVEYRPVLRDLHRFISELQKQGANGIWARFIENFFAPLFVGSFDFVVGNPPWVAPVHMPEVYRNKIIRLMRKSGYLEKYEPHFEEVSSRYRAAESAFVACLPFVSVALDRYLKPNDSSRISFLLTSSLAHSLNAGGWRKQVVETHLAKVVDLTPITDIHEGANCWAFITVLGQSIKESEVPYTFVHRGIRSKRSMNPERRPDLVFNRWELPRKDLLLVPGEPASPWLVAPREVGEIFHQMLRSRARIGDAFPMNRGLGTDDNATFFVRRVEELDGSHAKVTMENGESLKVESDLLFPYVVGEDVDEWSVSYRWILLPYDKRSWTPIPEPTLNDKFPETYSYFLRHRATLARRAQYRQLGSDTPLWTVFQFSANKVNSQKVAYPLVEKILKATLIPQTATVAPFCEPRPVLVDHVVYHVNAPSRKIAVYLAALLNSTPYRALAFALAHPKGGFPYRQYKQWNIGALPYVAPSLEPTAVSSLIREVETAIKNRATSSIEFRRAIDETVKGILGLNSSQLQGLSRFLAFSLGQSKTWAEGSGPSFSDTLVERERASAVVEDENETDDSH